MAAAASVRALISKAVLSIQEVWVEGEGLNPYPTDREPRAAQSEMCGLFSCLWMALLTQRVCVCAHALGPLFCQPPPLPSLVCGTPTPGQADRAPALYLSDRGRLLPLIPLIHGTSARAASLRKSNLFSNYRRRWARTKERQPPAQSAGLSRSWQSVRSREAKGSSS